MNKFFNKFLCVFILISVAFGGFNGVSLASTDDFSMQKNISYFKNTLKGKTSNFWESVFVQGSQIAVSNNSDIQKVSISALQLGTRPQITDKAGLIINNFIKYKRVPGEALQLSQAQAADGWFSNVLNQHIWAMIALNFTGVNYNTNAAAQKIISLQNTQGQYYQDSNSTIDYTAMAIIALSPLCSDSKIKTSVDKAVEFLHSSYSGSGFKSAYGYSSNTDAICISALLTGGEDIFSAKWTINGLNPVNILLKYQLSNGAFRYKLDQATSNIMATQQAMIALCDTYLRYNTNIKKSSWLAIPDYILQIVKTASATPMPISSAPVSTRNTNIKLTKILIKTSPINKNTKTIRGNIPQKIVASVALKFGKKKKTVKTNSLGQFKFIDLNFKKYKKGTELIFVATYKSAKAKKLIIKLK